MSNLALFVQNLAFAARETKTPIDKRRPETPLGYKHPYSSSAEPAEGGFETSRRERRREGATEGRVGEDEEEEGETGPEPADFDEVEVEDVLFVCEIRRRDVWWEGLLTRRVEGVVDVRRQVGE